MVEDDDFQRMTEKGVRGNGEGINGDGGSLGKKGVEGRRCAEPTLTLTSASTGVGCPWIA